MDPPQIDEAQVAPRQAAEEFEWCSAGPVDIGRNELAQARAYYLSGDVDTARSDERREFTTSCYARIPDRRRRR